MNEFLAQLLSYGQKPAPFSLQNPGTALSAVASPPASKPGMFDSFLDHTSSNGITTQGWGMPAIAGVGALINGFLGMKQYGLAKDALAQSQKQFGMNWNANATLTNANLADRQTARIAANPGAYQSVGDYMKKNGVAANG